MREREREERAPRTREKNVSRAVRGREWGGLWTSGGD